MAKKKQPDFQQVKLKPGRRINKAANQTQTRFKAKKIVVPNTKIKSRNESTNTIPDCMKIIKENSHLATRRKALKDLNMLISKNPELLTPFLSDVLEHVLRLILDMDLSLRNASLEVITTVFKNTSHSQLQSFVPLFVKITSCGMAHTKLKIKEDSLKLLMLLLTHHESLICHSVEILTHLLQLLNGETRTRSFTHSKNAMMLFSEDVFTPDWQVHILKHIHACLNGMWKKKLAKKNCREEEQAVYFDAKGPMFLPIYSEGGLKPFDIEKVYSASEEDFVDSEQFLTFLKNIVTTLPFLFAKETYVDRRCDDKTYDYKTICNIDIIFQIYCLVSDLLILKRITELDAHIFNFLKECVHDKGKFPFSQKEAVFGRDEKSVECVQLNLRVTRLLCLYLNTGDEKGLLDSVYEYMEFVYKLSPILKCQCIPMIVDILNTFFLSKGEIAENLKFLHNNLNELCILYILCDREEETKKDILLSLFTKLCLESTYGLIAKTDCLKKWFTYILNKTCEMPANTKVDREILKVVKKISARSIPCFHECLEKVDFRKILRLLMSTDFDIADTAMFLLCNRKNINCEILKGICMCISSMLAPLNIRLIRMLAERFFNKKPEREETIPPEFSVRSGKGRIAFMQFALNLALDACNLRRSKFTSFNANEPAQSLRIFENVTPFIVIPSLHWKKHEDIFESCCKYLSWLPEHYVCGAFKVAFQEITHEFMFLPVHCTIALFKLMENYLTNKEKYMNEIHDLCFASLLTISTLTSMSLGPEWSENNILKLTKSMAIDRDLAFGVVCRIEFLEDNSYDLFAAHHMLRIYKYFIEKMLLNEDNFQEVMGCLAILKEKCRDKYLDQQPLYKHLESHFRYYLGL